MAYDDIVARFTLAGSMISCIATCCVLVSYTVYREELRSFRQALVFNLALAEFMNTLNNSISGCIYIRTRTLKPGTACVANGFINQLTVQAVDFTVMAIVSVTLLTITQKTYLPSVSFRAKTAICLSTWVVPVITSSIAVGMGAMSPVSGNWCWITAERTDLRYALTHGWRIAIIFLTVLLYAYIWWYVRCHFKALFGSEKGRSGGYNPFTGTITSQEDNLKTERIALDGEMQPLDIVTGSMDAPRQARAQPRGESVRQSKSLGRQYSSTSPEPPIRGGEQSREPDQATDDVTHGWSPLQKPAQTRRADQREPYPECDGAGGIHQGITRSFDIHVSFAEQRPPQTPPPGNGQGLSTPPYQHPVAAWSGPQVATSSCTSTNRSSATRPLVHTPRSQHPRRGFEREVRRMLLLNGYPTLYVLLWIPGIMNRFMEATGTSPSNTRIVGALQSTNQFVGFANALTFGLSATMRRRIVSAAPGSRWVGRSREAGEEG
ncbi:hypothetical protein Daus18300_014568 [Diaporthe australafricana]|uniref:Glucose receptor Git3-like N-terminal domain-containing protein n=1 Tax=Diaporthe australafricana TaxID=127596 RepID=A0ABR3VUE3_9PEZI